jgi:integrase
LSRSGARKPNEDTVAHFANLFIERYAKQKQRSWRETERVLDRVFLTTMGKKRLQDVTRRDVAGVLDVVAERAPVMANRAFSHFRRLCNWCVEQGYIDASPCNGLKAPGAATERERVLDDRELSDVWRAADAVGPFWSQIFKLLLLTAQRKSEVIGMEWEEIDFQERLWKIPGQRTKNGRAHEVPLTEHAMNILQEVPRVAGSRYVFSATGRAPSASQSRIKRLIDSHIEEARRARLNGTGREMPRWTIHDLRRTATTGMARLGIAPHIADAILNHKGGMVSGVAAVYNRYGYLEERRQALQIWENHVLEC